MLANGSIDAREADELLKKLEQPEPPPTDPPPVRQSKRARWLNVQVSDSTSGRHKVSVKIPLALASIGLRLGARYAPDLEQLNWDEVLAQINTLEDEVLVEVQDQEEGESVRVFVS
jgi:hypothetical protein